MRYLLLLALMLPAAASAQSPRDRQLLSTYQRMLDGLVRRDTLALARVLTPGYTFLNANVDSALTRHQRFVMMQASEARTDTLFVKRCRFQGFARTAVGNCVVRESLLAQGQRYSQDVLSTVTFVRTRAGWQIAATHTRSRDKQYD